MNLKKLTALLLVLALSLCALAACKEEKDTSSTASTPAESNSDNTSSENTASSDESKPVYTYDDALEYIENGKYEEAYTVLYSLKNENKEAKELLGKFKAVYTKNIWHFPLETNYYTYDDKGMLLKWECETESGEREVVLETEYEYDENGNVIKIKEIDTWSQSVNEYEYNEQNQCIKQIRNGKVWLFTYDEQGRLIKTYCPDTDDYTECKYDDNGNIIREVDTIGGRDIERFFDDNGVKIKEIITYDNGSISVYEYVYEENGNVKTTIKNAEDDAEITYIWYDTYDANGNLIKKTIFSVLTNFEKIIQYTYDNNGNLLTKAQGSIDYDDDGNIVREDEPRVTDEYSDYIYFYYPDGVPQSNQ